MNLTRTASFRFVAILFSSFLIASSVLAQPSSPTPTPPPPDPFALQKAPPLPAGMKGSDATDPRAKLTPGLFDAGEAAFGIKHLQLLQKPDAFQLGLDPAGPKMGTAFGALGIGDPSIVPAGMRLLLGGLAFANSDLAFQGSRVFVGNFYGINIYDIADPADAKLLTSMVCPGGQGDVSVFGNLMFMSVEMQNGRLDCGEQGFPAPPPPTNGQGGGLPAASKERFRGVRIFDISDIHKPKQIAAVQTCRGSHTHTLVADPKDKANVYIYVSGTSFVRQDEELAGCSAGTPDKNPDTALFRIEVIKVPLANPQDAKIVSAPRIFMESRTGEIAGLKSAATHGTGTPTPTDQCHDITAYPELGLAAGACSGNGIILDIKDPANPKRIDAVNDPNYAYWHSAAFSNDGKKVVFTDEWGGGMGARCRANDPDVWGADAVFNLKDNKLRFAGYYKLPAAQADSENCVAHNGSLIPVPGRDLKIQAWYQGGISLMDFTDPAKPVEIAYFDRGPIDDKMLVMGGSWSAYWYNGRIYSSEIARGLDIFELTPTEYLSQNEIDAAKAVHADALNVQTQQRFHWPNSPAVAKAYLDQLERSRALPAAAISAVRAAIDKQDKSKMRKLGKDIGRRYNASFGPDGVRMQALAAILKEPGI